MLPGRGRAPDRSVMLIARARQDGEETAEVARSFDVSAATVVALNAQLNDATTPTGHSFGGIKCAPDGRNLTLVHTAIEGHDRAVDIQPIRGPLGCRDHTCSSCQWVRRNDHADHL